MILLKYVLRHGKKKRPRHYSISNKESYTILEVAKLFQKKIKYLPKRDGERYASALTNMNLSNKVYKHCGKIKLKDYVKKFIEITGCSGNNLKNINVQIPVGLISGICGVSGSGKSTLINETLYPIFNNRIYNGNKVPLPFT